MAIFTSFGIFKNFRKKEVVRKGHEAPTRVEGTPLLGTPPYLVGTSCASRTLFSCTLRILVGKNSLYKLPNVLTTVSGKYPLFSFRAVSVSDLEHHGVSKRSQGQVFQEDEFGCRFKDPGDSIEVRPATLCC